METLVTGGAGFIGANLSATLADEGHSVRVLDNLSRRGVQQNARWLQERFGSRVRIIEADVRDRDAVRSAAAGVDEIYHLAAQVAVTTSVTDPRSDFETNLLGTINVLEAVRAAATPPRLLFTSTNKVYGGMEDLEIRELERRYEYRDLSAGVDETRRLDFHSPYGCSKGGADQYVLDHARVYGLPAVVFRMSCIYGPRQFGNEDQGWVAHFARAYLKGQPIRIYGDGKQIRDVLFVGDLVRAQVTAQRSAACAGQVYNIGGGPQNTVSLLELLDDLSRLTGRTVPVSFHEWRPGDQQVYVTNTGKAARDFGWKPLVDLRSGLAKLVDWLSSDEVALEKDAPAALTR
jgi:CDP-paratose 2-epimerase